MAVAQPKRKSGHSSRAVAKKIARVEKIFRVSRDRKRDPENIKAVDNCDEHNCNSIARKERVLAGKSRIAQNRIVNSQNNFSGKAVAGLDERAPQHLVTGTGQTTKKPLTVKMRSLMFLKIGKEVISLWQRKLLRRLLLRRRPRRPRRRLPRSNLHGFEI